MDDRRDDWKHGVDENLASLNASQRVWDHEQKLIRKKQIDHDNLLRGDPERETDGLIARVHHLENEINLLKAIILKDAAGGKGLVGRVTDIENGEKRADRTQRIWLAVIGLISAVIAGAIANLDRIEAFFHKRDTDPIHQAIERAKRPKGRKRVIIRTIPAESGDPAESQGRDPM